VLKDGSKWKVFYGLKSLKNVTTPDVSNENKAKLLSHHFLLAVINM